MSFLEKNLLLLLKCTIVSEMTYIELSIIITSLLVSMGNRLAEMPF